MATTDKKPHGLTGNQNAAGHGRPKAADPRKPRTIRATDAQWAAVQRKASASGMTVTDWLLRDV